MNCNTGLARHGSLVNVERGERSTMPSLEQTEKIKNRIGILSDPLYIITEGQSGERNVMDQDSGSTIIGKQEMQQ